MKLQVGFDGCSRAKTGVVHQIVDIGKGCRNVARLLGKEIFANGLAQGFLQYFDQLHQFHGC